jgi:hypothetical protein
MGHRKMARLALMATKEAPATATLLLVPIIAPPLVMAGVDPVLLGIVTFQPDDRAASAAWQAAQLGGFGP